MNGRSLPGSALVLVGNFEVDDNKLLKVNEMKLVFCFEATFLSYQSSVTCLYNIKSFYQKQATLRKFNEDQLLKEQEDQIRKEEAIKAARARVDASREKQKQTPEAERKINDDSVSMEERLKAVEFLGR